ncbi:TonB-dependent receptor plug domain-containing protein [Hymenobacter volaticus]|uniref:TonB-dependent receptor plug domain-containing protein n=1 Tax=Hymenobacter volaticus TaxID=2932254 RepID=A0ABY4GAA9_9BACT|nr:TonB-dependent receptor plug domain-containing protein [Hymenobacter volaticus]UOQ67802.1 TonB-dependent receptor plug domain-containing protein [Hymenobacter volaticus]
MPFPTNFLVAISLLLVFTQTAHGQLPDDLQVIRAQNPDSISKNLPITCRPIRQTSNEPLHIIDGAPATQEQVYALNPNQIKEINALKGPEATAIYGSLGVKGALIITTKRRFRTNR